MHQQQPYLNVKANKVMLQSKQNADHGIVCVKALLVAVEELAPIFLEALASASGDVDGAFIEI